MRSSCLGRRLLRVLRRRKRKSLFGKSDGSERNSDEMVDFYTDLVNKFPIRSIEDGCDENDWDGWKKLTDAIGDRVSSSETTFSLPTWISSKKVLIREWPIYILVKVNQIGSLTETFDAVEMAKRLTLRLSLTGPAKPRRHDCRHRGRGKRRPDQNWLTFSHRPDLQIQPIAPNRRTAWRSGRLRGKAPISRSFPRPCRG